MVDFKGIISVKLNKKCQKNGVRTVKNVKLAMPILMQFSYGDTALIKITLYMRFLIRANKSLNY